MFKLLSHRGAAPPARARQATTPKFLEEALEPDSGGTLSRQSGSGDRDRTGRSPMLCDYQRSLSTRAGPLVVGLGFVRVLVQGGQKRDTLFADTPTIYELMDKHKTRAGWNVSPLCFFRSMGRPSYSAAQHGPARSREAYEKMINDSNSSPTRRTRLGC
jgi:hypothetical protein